MQHYHGIREKAKIIDYGSHEAFEAKLNKSLVDKKR